LLDVWNIRRRTPPGTMGRMYSRGKGISGSALPYKKSSPSWLKTTPQEVRDEVDA